MLVAGMMSGTSADAIDTAIVDITGTGWNTKFRLIAFHSVRYPPAVRERILAVAAGASVGAPEVSQLNFLLGDLFARACIAACRRTRVPLGKLQLIGSHGQTIFHQNSPAPFCGAQVRSTLQIGEPAIIAERTGVTTIADFRTADVAAGGQGAPLIPFFDYLLFRHRSKGRIALNIGGIANITAIPAAGSPEQVIAFDTGPGNMLLDALAVRATNGRCRYDAGGRLAGRGTVLEPLLKRLLRQSYFHRQPPKTAGREQFGREYLQRHFLDPLGCSPEGLQNALATATALTTESIASAIRNLVLPKFPVAECIVSGGGVKNDFLMGQLRIRLADAGQIELVDSGSAGVPAHAKEAIAFAVLAYHTFHHRPSNLPAATGARHPAILGKIVHAR